MSRLKSCGPFSGGVKNFRFNFLYPGSFARLVRRRIRLGKSPQIVLAEFGTTGTAADITILANSPATEVKSAQFTANVTHGVLVQPKLIIYLIVALSVGFLVSNILLIPSEM
jgi:hypothetical protein